MLRGVPYNSKKVLISYSDSNLQWSGRWNTTVNGKTSGWGGSYVRFKIRNTSTILVKAICNLTNTSTFSICSYHLDSEPNPSTTYYLKNSGAVFNGTTSAEIPVINDGQWHEVIIFAGSLIAEQWAKIVETTITGFELSNGGEISAATIGAKVLQFVGDSWNGSFHDYPRLLNLNNYSFYQNAAGGLTAGASDGYYNYDYSGILNTTDLTADAVVASFGVNDFNAGITVPNFQNSLLALVDKIRAKQPLAPIFLVRVPSNTGASKAYGQYGTAMSNIAGLRSNVIYCDTSSLDAQMDWLSDNNHLGANGKLLLADFLETTLISNGI